MAISTKPTLLIETTSIEDVTALIPFDHPLSHPDVLIIGADDEAITIDAVRQLQAQVLQRPYQAEYVVYILKHIDGATHEAQQALLKLLEEPPSHVQFILMVQYQHMLLPTILSRAVRVDTTRLRDTPESTDNIAQLLSNTLSERLVWAGTFSKLEETSRAVSLLLKETQILLEKNPTKELVMVARALNTAADFLDKRVNPKLVMEWVALHVPQ